MFWGKIFSRFSLKFLMGLSIVLMAICVILVITLSEMAPEVHVIPQLFRKDPMMANQFVEATVISPNVRPKESKLIDEMLIRFYVENRYFYIPDLGELAYRYGRNGPIARLSTPSIYFAFVKSKGNYLENVQNNRGTVSVDIWRINRRDNVFYVDFDIYRMTEGRQAFGGTKRATIKIDHNWNRRNMNRRDFVNPYGFYVKSYDETSLVKR